MKDNYKVPLRGTERELATLRANKRDPGMN